MYSTVCGQKFWACKKNPYTNFTPKHSESGMVYILIVYLLLMFGFYLYIT